MTNNSKDILLSAKAIFFDLNGTLLQDRSFHHQAFEKVLLAEGVILIPDEYDQRIMTSLNHDIWPSLFQREMSNSEIERLSLKKEAYYLALITKIQPTPGSLELLAYLKANNKITALVTTSPASTVERVLALLGLQGLFAFIFSGDEVTTGKPDPAIYRLALQKTNTPPSEVVALEDSPFGIQSACAAGICTIGVLTEFPAETLFLSGATVCIADFKEILE